MTIESNIKSELAPILEFVLRLPTNDPRAVQVSHRGEKGCGGVGTSKDYEKGTVVRKFSSTQILTSLPISLTITSTTTTTRSLTKGITINEGAGGSSSSSVAPISNDVPRNIGKAISIVLS